MSAWVLGITIILVYDYRIVDVIHDDISKYDIFRISSTPLQRVGKEHEWEKNDSLLSIASNYYDNIFIWKGNIYITCQVLIRTPFVVPLNLTVSTTTPDTYSAELSAPKLPMLQDGVDHHNTCI